MKSLSGRGEMCPALVAPEISLQRKYRGNEQEKMRHGVTGLQSMLGKQMQEDC